MEIDKEFDEEEVMNEEETIAFDEDYVEFILEKCDTKEEVIELASKDMAKGFKDGIEKVRDLEEAVIWLLSYIEASKRVGTHKEIYGE